MICNEYRQTAAKVGLTIPQVTLLAGIVRHPGARATDFAASLVLERSTLSRNLAHLEKRGLISIQRGEGKNRHLHPTKDGESRIQDVYSDWSRSQKKAAKILGEAGALALKTIKS